MLPERKGFFTAVCLAALLCGVFAGRAFAAQEEIRFGYLGADQLHCPAVLVMKEKKLLEAAGFTVTWSEFLTGTHAMQAMASDTLDFACCGVVPIMTAHAQDVKLAILAGANEEGSSLVVTHDVTSITGLDGRKIATPGSGTIQDTMLAQWARAHHIRIKRTTMKVSDMPGFLQTKDIDGFIAWAPYPARAVKNASGHELLTSHDMMPGHQCCALVTRESALRNSPAGVSRLLRIYLDASMWFLNNQDESVTMLAKAVGMSEDIVRNALTTVRYPYPPYCNVASMRSMAQGLIASGKIASVQETELAPFLKSLYRPELLENMFGRLPADEDAR